jgi:hypothetical protein
MSLQGFSQTVTLGTAQGCYTNGGTISVSFTLTGWSAYGTYSRSITGGNGTWTVPVINVISPNRNYIATYQMSAADTVVGMFYATLTVSRVYNNVTTTKTSKALIYVNTKPGILQNPLNFTTCGGNSAAFSVVATGDYLSYRWQVSSNGGASWTNVAASYPYSGSTSANLTISNVNGLNNFKYRCIVNCTGACQGNTTTSTPATLLNISTSNGGTLTGGTSVCYGVNSTTLTLTSYTGTILKWQSSIDNWSTYTDIANTSATYIANNLIANTKFRAVVQSGTCTPGNSTEATINVSNSSIGGSVSGGTAVCYGVNSTTLVLSGFIGNILSWQSSTDNWSTFSTLQNNTTTLTATNLLASTKYRAVVQNGTCPPAYSADALITVSTPTLGGTISGGTTVCYGNNNTTLVLSGQTGAVLKWQYSTDNWLSATDLANTSTTYNVVNLTVNTLFRAVIENPGCFPQNSTDASFIVDPATVGGTISGGQFVCSGTNNTLLTLTGYSGSILYWESSTDNWATSNQIANTNATYTAVDLTSITKYRAVVKSGVCNSENSAEAIVSAVTTEPEIKTQPEDASTCLGSGSSFSVNATGTGVTYQWQISTSPNTWNNVSNLSPYSGATSSTLSISSTTLLMDGYSYRCEVAAPCPLFTDEVTLSVNTSATTNDPSDASVCEGSNTSFSVSASGGSIVYQWQVSTNNGSSWSNLSNNTIYSGVDSATLNITAAVIGMNGYDFRCRVSNSCPATDVSSSANLTVNTLPSISYNSGNSTVCEGSGTSFGITATGSGISYQWQVDDGTGFSNIASAGSYYSGYTSNTLQLSGSAYTMDGYNYRCYVSGTCTPPATSNTMLLTVNQITGIDTEPVNDSACIGTNAGFSVTAHGANLTYSWQIKTGPASYSSLSNNSTYNGVGTNSLTISNVNNSLVGSVYRCAINGSCSSANTVDVALEVQTSPVITTDPHYSNNNGNSPCENQLCVIEVHATGSVLTYQWQLSTDNGISFVNLSNGTDYSNVTTNQVQVTNPVLAMVGYQYRCYVAGACTPAVNSNSVTFEVRTLTTIDNQPADAEICQGSGYNTSFTVAASGYGLNYQWQRGYTVPVNQIVWENISNNSIYSGVLTNSLSISNAIMIMNGFTYRCVVDGYCNDITTNSATLTVYPTTVGGTVNSNADVCINSNSTILTLTGHTGSVVNWEYSTDNWLTTYLISNTNPTYTATNLGTTTKFRAVVKSGTCVSAYSGAATVTVHNLPVVSFGGALEDQPLCGEPYALTGGSPTGGSYSGPGVSNNMFTPGLAGTGTHTITYTYTDGFGCSNSATNSIYVEQAQQNVFLVGVGGDFTNLTANDGLFKFLNDNRRCGDVTAVILNDLNESGLNGLNQSDEVAPGGYAVTIIPIDEAEKTISGNYAGALIRLYGIDRLTIDGGVFWPYRALRFVNNNANSPTLLVGNGVTNSEVTGCVIEGNNTNTNNGVVVLESTLAPNYDILFSRNIIGNITGTNSAPAILFYANGTSPNQNYNITLDGNEFRNFSSCGITVTGSGNGNNWTLYNNSFYATMPFSTNQTSISFIPGSGSTGNVLNTNYIGGSTYQIYNDNFINTGSGYFKGISVFSGNSTISGNSIGNILLSNQAAPAFTGIEILAGTATVSQSNIIGSKSVPYSITIAGSGTFYGIKSVSTSAVTIRGNAIANINYSATQGSPKIYAISLKRGSADKNYISNIGCLNSTMTPFIYGVYNEANNNGNTISNNMISLKGGNAINPKLYGIYDKSVGNSGSFIHNTVFIQGNGNSTAAGITTAFYREGTSPLTLYNNILYNSRVSNSIAKHYAIYSTTTSAITTNYNDLITASLNLVYWGGTNYANLNLWKTTLRDINSISVAPVFISATDLHLTIANTGINNKGTGTNSISYDIDGSTRSLTNPDMGCDEFSLTPTFTEPEIIQNDKLTTLISTYPNPVSEKLNVSILLHEESNISIKMFDLTGRIITTVCEKNVPSGEQNIHWNIEHIPSGTYILQLIVNGQESIHKKIEVIR